jgi:hypothetical protein
MGSTGLAHRKTAELVEAISNSDRAGDEISKEDAATISSALSYL